MKSAKILLEEAKSNPKKPVLYDVTPVPLMEECGVTALAFALPEMLRKFGGHICELALDSACESYRAHYFLLRVSFNF